MKDLVMPEKVIERESILRKEAEEVAMIAFEMRVQELMSSGAKSYEMAMRWIHEAEGTDGDDEFLCYELGLPYRYFVVKETV